MYISLFTQHHLNYSTLYHTPLISPLKKSKTSTVLSTLPGGTFLKKNCSHMFARHVCLLSMTTYYQDISNAVTLIFTLTEYTLTFLFSMFLDYFFYKGEKDFEFFSSKSFSCKFFFKTKFLDLFFSYNLPFYHK